MKKFIINVDLYNTDVEIVCNCSQKEYVDYINKKYKSKESIITGIAGRYDCLGDSGKNKLHCIYIPKIEKTVRFQEVLAHECFHAVFSILNIAGVKLVDESDEAYAYLLSYLVHECLNNFLKIEKNVQRYRKTRINKRSKVLDKPKKSVRNCNASLFSRSRKRS